ncbi:unnamed protein product [Thelazia callipaeda]|uniref:Inner membrane protein n=1 Tax=Thelazia callipaeda TaxID=103827 RepID=A0A0N5CTV2_THECL|nr:unnamed protein product [Thelazia callipaeda]
MIFAAFGVHIITTAVRTWIYIFGLAPISQYCLRIARKTVGLEWNEESWSNVMQQLGVGFKRFLVRN